MDRIEKFREAGVLNLLVELKVGVLLDEPEILAGFDYVFYEVKPSSGRILKPLPRAWNVVNCFADNTMAEKEPDLVAVCKGEKAKRGTPSRFLWDWICPSRIPYRDYCMNFIRQVASQDISGIRLDSVCFPREGYCDCENCAESIRDSGMEPVEWRANQITSFVREVRDNIECSVGFTLEPDPCYGKERFGLDLHEISKNVDFVVTPLYMDYSIVYWLDILANCFRRKLSKPYFIELYAGHPRAPTKYLASALAVASKYADAVIFSAYQARLARNLQTEMATDPTIKKFFEERDRNDILEVLKTWEKMQ
jgi:hypothetical protein